MEIVQEWSNGDETALDKLMEGAYPEIHRMAQQRFSKEHRMKTLQPTVLVNEVFCRLKKQNPEGADLQSLAQFYGMVGRLIRQILVDHARKRRREWELRVPNPTLGLEDEEEPSELGIAEIIELDVVLEKLKELNERQYMIVHLRFFVGLKIEEIATMLSISERTVRRAWLVARTWLKRELEGEASLALF